VQWDAQARAEFLADRLGPGRWRTVRHSHPVLDGEVTPPHHRYPSGGDMAGAFDDAQLTGEPQRETLDIVTEDGPAEIGFGYDPGRGQRPFWVELPGPDGRPVTRDFASVEGYTEWYEGETGNYDPPPLPAGPDGRNAPGREPTRAGRRPPPTPNLDQLPDGSII
jgi:hypothetical protein